MGEGLNFFTNAVDKTPATMGSYQDVDVSGDGVPEGASGVILELRCTSTGQWNDCKLRKNGSSFDPYFGRLGFNHAGGYAFVPIDANRVFEATVSENVELWLIGYTGSDVVYFDSPSDDAPSAAGSWQDIDKSGSIPSGATGVICLILNVSSTQGVMSGIRKNGSTDEFPYGSNEGSYGGGKWQYCGLDANRVFECKISTTSMDLYVFAYTKGEITFKTNGEENSPSQANQWTDVDVTAQTAANADGVLLLVKTVSSWGEYEAHVRKNGSSDNRTSDKVIVDGGGTPANGGCAGLAIGLDSEQIYEAYMGSTTELHVYVIGYNAPAGATLQTVTDALALSESVLRNKALLPVSDSVGLADSLYGNKLLLLGDSASLSEFVTVIMGEVMKYVTDSVNIADLVSTPSRVLRALEAIGATDNVAVNKVLQITETVSLAEIVEVGVGSTKKTKLFLILGDLAVQLTGD